MQRHKIVITGAAGYVGAMLVQSLALCGDVESIIGLDKEPLPEMLTNESKLTYLQMNTADEWEALVRAQKPDIMIHAAWQIREMYGEQEVEWKWNVDGSDKVFDFCLDEHFVKRLIYFSTVASYGATAENTIEHRFKESEPFRKSQYLYAEEKRIVEEHLKEKYALRENKNIDVRVLRPAAITGPRGRFMRIRFGLQAALSGQLKENFVYRFVSKMVSFVPVTEKWCRQFVHEDDVAAIVETLAFGSQVPGYEAYNLCPPGAVVRGADMARAVGKRAVRVSPRLIRFVFFVMWHLTRGKVPTGAGAWRGYSYPIAVDGSKLTRLHNYHYTHSSFDAFYYTDGKYEEFVPPAQRRSRLQ